MLYVVVFPSVNGFMENNTVGYNTTFRECRTHFICSSDFTGTCNIMYNYNNMVLHSSNKLNEEFALDFLPPRTNYMFNLTFKVDGLTQMLRSTFSTEDGKFSLFPNLVFAFYLAKLIISTVNNGCSVYS